MVNDSRPERARKSAGSRSIPRTPWLEAVGQIRERCSTKPADRKARVHAVATVAAETGYTVGVLRRMLAAADFLEGIPAAARPDPEFIGRSFAALELIRRIAGPDPAKASSLMSGLASGNVTIGQLRKTLKEVKEPTPSRERSGSEGAAVPPSPLESDSIAHATSRSWTASGPRLSPTRGERESVAMQKLRDMVPDLSGRVYVFSKPFGPPPAGIRCDAIAWLDREYKSGDGFELAYSGSRSSRASLSDLVARTVVAATFFRRYYLAFSSDSDVDHVASAIESLQLLDAKTVGVVFLGMREPLLRKPKGIPTPDRRALLQSLCRKGQWTPTR